MNWYGYCGGNPVGFVDPFGLSLAGAVPGKGKDPEKGDWEGKGHGTKPEIEKLQQTHIVEVHGFNNDTNTYNYDVYEKKQTDSPSENEANNEKAVGDARESVSKGGGGTPKSPNDVGKTDDKGNNDDAIGTSLGMMGGGGGEDTLLKAGAMLLVVGGATSETGIGLGIAATALAILAADQVIKKTKEVVTEIEEKNKKKTYQLYQKVNPVTGDVYIGRTSGINDPYKNVEKRDYRHHMWKYGFGKATLLETSNDKNFIRGLEQFWIMYYKSERKSGNSINGISNTNPNGSIYLNRAMEEFMNQIQSFAEEEL